MPRPANYVQKYCSVAGCNRIHYGRSWCRRHYKQWLSTGNPIPAWEKVAKPGEGLEWIHSHVSWASDACLIWPFARSRSGYAHLDHVLTGSASRLMCILAHGNPPDRIQQSAHSCGKGHEGCVNPRHLRWATPVENSADKIKHDTTNRGERSAWAKLSEADVQLIREMAGRTSHEQIGRMFGVGRQQIDRIISGKRWGWYGAHGDTCPKAMSKSRATEYFWWRRRVLQRDNFTCRKCAKQERKNMNAHHIHPFALNSDLRLDTDNGATLCAPCHLAYHRIFGIRNANADTFAEYLTPIEQAA